MKRSLCDALGNNKMTNILTILANTYNQESVVFLQETALSMPGLIREHAALNERFHVMEPFCENNHRDQNSIILVARDTFDPDTALDLTPKVMLHLEDKSMVSPGDLCVSSVNLQDGTTAILGSFHGDTAGQATIPVVAAVLKAVEEVTGDGPPPLLLLGLDANAHFAGKPGKKLGADEFLAYVGDSGLATCYGSLGAAEIPASTYNARTFIQPQLNKAVRLADRETSPNTDRNPKDFIIFRQGQLTAGEFGLDNSGARTYDPKSPIPGTNFPSDHCALWTTVETVTSTPSES